MRLNGEWSEGSMSEMIRNLAKHLACSWYTGGKKLLHDLGCLQRFLLERLSPGGGQGPALHCS